MRFIAIFALVAFLACGSSYRIHHGKSKQNIRDVDSLENKEILMLSDTLSYLNHLSNDEQSRDWMNQYAREAPHVRHPPRKQNWGFHNTQKDEEAENNDFYF